MITVDIGLKHKGRGWLAVVDVASRQKIATIEVGALPLPVIFSRDGTRIYSFSVGGRLTIIDRATHEVVGSIALDRIGTALHESPNGRWIYLLADPSGGPYSPRVRGLYAPGRAGESTGTLFVVDAETLEVVDTIGLGPGSARMFPSTDGGLLYVLCSHGALHVIDAESATFHAKLDIGPNPSVIAGKLPSVGFAIGCERAPKMGSVLVVERSDIKTRLDLEDRPLRLEIDAGRDRAYVLCEHSVAVLNERLDKVTATIDLRKSGEKHALDEMLVSRDGTRVYVNSRATSKVMAIDVESGGVVAVAQTGRGGVKALHGFYASLAVLASGLAWYGGGGGAAGPYVPSNTTDLALGTRGDCVYAMNTQTDDVTVLSADDLSVIDKIPTGSFTMSIIPSPNPDHLYVLASKMLTIVDVAERTAIRQYRLRSPILRFDRSNGVGYVLTRHGLEVLDTRTGDLVGSSPRLPRPMGVVTPSIPSQIAVPPFPEYPAM